MRWTVLPQNVHGLAAMPKAFLHVERYCVGEKTFSFSTFAFTSGVGFVSGMFLLLWTTGFGSLKLHPLCVETWGLIFVFCLAKHSTGHFMGKIAVPGV